MFEVARDWNHAAAVICGESAFIFSRTLRAQIESAFVE
jgi:hypothetical protein